MPTKRSKLTYRELSSPAQALEALHLEFGKTADSFVAVMLGAKKQVLGIRSVADKGFPGVFLFMRETLGLLAQVKGVALSSATALTLIDDAARETHGQPRKSPAEVARLVEDLPGSAPELMFVLQQEAVDAHFTALELVGLAQEYQVDLLDYDPGRRGRRKGADWRREAAAAVLRFARVSSIDLTRLTQRTFARIEVASREAEGRAPASLVRAWEHARRVALREIQEDRVSRFGFESRVGRKWELTLSLEAVLTEIANARTTRELCEVAGPAAKLEGADRDMALAAYKARQEALKDPKEIGGSRKK